MANFEMLTKELVSTFTSSDIYTNRSAQKEITIKGRTYIKTGTKLATVFVGNLYKVLDIDEHKYKYLLLVGCVRQKPEQFIIVYNDFIEDAVFNAFVDPISTVVLDEPISEEQFNKYCDSIKDMLPIEFLLTNEEIEA